MWLLDVATMRERLPDAEQELHPSFHAALLSSGSRRLILRYEQTGEPPRFSIGVASSPGTGLTWTTARVAWTMPSVYLPSSLPSTHQDVKHFGEVEAAKRQGELLPALR